MIEVHQKGSLEPILIPGEFSSTWQSLSGALTNNAFWWIAKDSGNHAVAIKIDTILKLVDSEEQED